MNLEPGTRVKVEFEGVVEADETSGWLLVDDGNFVHQIWHADDAAQVFTVVVVRPEANAGDVWKTPEGNLFLVRESMGVVDTWFYSATLGKGSMPSDTFFEKYPDAVRVFDASSA